MATFERPPTPDAWKGLKFSRVIPTFEVSSVEQSIKFYTDRLPFYLAGRDGDNHCWMSLHGSNAINPFTGSEQGSVNIYLRRRGFASHYESDGGDLSHTSPGVGLAHVRMDGNDKSFKEFYHTIKSSGILADGHELMATPWGTLTFRVTDPDGNHIQFYISQRPTSSA